jgi:fructose 1,6-bisphosphatase
VSQESKIGRELFLFTNSKHYCVPDLLKTVGACKDYIIKHHYKTHHQEKYGMFALCDKLCELTGNKKEWEIGQYSYD